MRMHSFAKAITAAVTAVFLLSIVQTGLCAASATRTKRPEETAMRYTPVPEVTPAVAEPVATPTPSATAAAFPTAEPEVVYPTAAPNEGDRLSLLYRSAMACGIAGVVLLGVAIAMPRGSKKKAKRSSPRSAAKKPAARRKRA